MIKLDFYLSHVRDMRQAGCLSLDSGEATDHALHLRLLGEEQLEFVEAYAEGSRAGMADALADIVVVASGYLLDAGKHALIDVEQVIRHCEAAAKKAGINLPAAFLMVHDSNISKLLSAEMIDDTRQKYADKGIQVVFKEVGDNLYSAFAANEAGGIPAGKWLKGTGFKEPNWSESATWSL